MFYWEYKKLLEGGSRLEDVIVRGGQPNYDKKQTREGRGVENCQIFVDVIYGWPQNKIILGTGCGNFCCPHTSDAKKAHQLRGKNLQSHVQSSDSTFNGAA